MSAANSAAFNDNDETSVAATCLAIENALNSSLTGHDAADKGYGVQQIRDANGKIVEVVVFFDDKVPNEEKSAALTKIAGNSGVATVQEKVTKQTSENFDTLVLGLAADLNANAWNHLTPILGGNTLYLQADTRFSGAAPGVSAAAVTIVDSKSASAPNSAECTVDVTSGSYAGVYSSANVRSPAGDPWPMTPLPISSMVVSAKYCAPAANGDFAAAADRFIRTSLLYWGGSGLLNFAWEAPTVALTPPTVLPFSNSRSNLTIVSGTASDIDLPMDGAFHSVRVEMISQTVVGSAGARFEISVDGGPVVVVQLDSTATVVMSPKSSTSQFSGVNWNHGITSVPTSFAFSGAYTYICNWDDISVSFTLA